MNRSCPPHILASFVVVSLFFTAVVRGQEGNEIEPDGPWLGDIAWLDNDSLVATNSQSLLYRSAKVVRINAGQPDDLETLAETENISLWAIDVNEAGTIAVSDYKGNIYVVANGKLEKLETEDSRWVRALRFAPDGKSLVTGTEDGKLLVLDVEAKSQTKVVEAHKAQVFDIRFSNAGDTLAASCYDGSIKLMSWPEMKELKHLKGGSEPVWSLAFTADDKQLVSSGADSVVRVWNLENSETMSLTTTPNWGASLVQLPGSSVIVVGGLDGSITTADLKTLHSIEKSKQAESGIWTVAVSPDGKKLAVGTRKDGLKILPTAPIKKAARKAAKNWNKVAPAP